MSNSSKDKLIDTLQIIQMLHMDLINTFTAYLLLSVGHTHGALV